MAPGWWVVGWAGAAGVALAVAVLGGVGDWRRRNRRDLDRVGWVDWVTVQMLALIVALVCAGVAWRG